MCPACIASATWLAAGSGAAGMFFALVLRPAGRRRQQANLPDNPCPADALSPPTGNADANDDARRTSDSKTPGRDEAGMAAHMPCAQPAKEISQ